MALSVLDTVPRLHHHSKMEKSIVSELTGVEAVTEWFEGWPSFHDAEVISIFLAREGRSVLRVYPYYPQKPATVDFILEDVTDIELYDFSGQNVINSLEVEIANRSKSRQDIPRSSRSVLWRGGSDRC
jgi:hypothetical protein